mmetsp:Transcript_21404/g.50741  ORF Transcript_21404/g.50741 Transcript_21404/m.50741 type:complete len:205 (+) Transcript_21404:464-1078(+)
MPKRCVACLHVCARGERGGREDVPVMLFASALCERDDLSTSSESCGCKPAASQPSARPLSLWDLKLFEHEEAPREVAGIGGVLPGAEPLDHRLNILVRHLPPELVAGGSLKHLADGTIVGGDLRREILIPLQPHPCLGGPLDVLGRAAHVLEPQARVHAAQSSRVHSIPLHDVGKHKQASLPEHPSCFGNHLGSAIASMKNRIF